ncbi:MAG TPA: hypothetical protein VGL93_10415 [Streptosporangiaceae bacterium]|jgi:hypothetical protein
MTTTITTPPPADKRHGLTLDELARFVQDAYRKDIPGDAPVRVNRVRAKRAEVTG